jgi:hypothetical protein
MPTVHIRSVRCRFCVARAVAGAVPCSLDGVWCTFQELGVETLGDRRVVAMGRIVYVDLAIRARGDPGASLRALSAACLAAAVAFGVPVEDVWGLLHPVEPGSVFAGGGLVD